MGSLLASGDQSSSQISILCFGDSLISGFYKDWDNWYKHPKNGMPTAVFYSPFSLTLESLILDNCNISKEKQLIIKTKGVPGQCAIHMIDRLNKCLNETNFDLVIICAGTNDIALVSDTEKITNSLIQMHELCNKYECKSVITTIPECEKQTDAVINKRNMINDALKKYAENHQQNAMLFDLHSKLPYHSLKEDKKTLYWNDGLHFTPKGYQFWGQMLYQFLTPSIKQLYNEKFSKNNHE